MITRQELLNCLKGAGIDLQLRDCEDVNINDYLEDSIHFISTLVELENVFGIEIEDKYLCLTKIQIFGLTSKQEWTFH